MTNDESTWSWWLIFLATEGAVFRKSSGAASHATDVPLNYSNLKQGIQEYPTGGINHQNTCGHGFTWRESFRFVETHDKGPGGRIVPKSRGTGHGTTGRTLLGASPAEIARRGKRRRWSSE